MGWVPFIAQDEKGFKCLLPRVEGVLETRSVQNKWDIRLRVVLNKAREIEDHAALSRVLDILQRATQVRTTRGTPTEVRVSLVVGELVAGYEL